MPQVTSGNYLKIILRYMPLIDLDFCTGEAKRDLIQAPREGRFFVAQT